MPRKHSRAIALTAVGVSSLLASAPAEGQSFQYTPVVLSGQQAAGAPAGAQYGATHAPVITPSGQIAFYELLKIGPGGVTSSNEFALFGPDSSGALTMLAREGDQAHGTAAGTKYQEFYGGLAARGAWRHNRAPRL